MSDGKRHLPILQPKKAEGSAESNASSAEGDGEEQDRPPWHWSAIGAVATFIVWIPLAMLAQLWARSTAERLVPGQDEAAQREAFLALTPAERLWLSALNVLGPMVALALASFAAGVLVGRFGNRAGKKEATMAGVLTGTIASLINAPGMLAAGQGAEWALAAIVLTILAGVAARGGSALGLHLRPRATRA
jgi:MFS family permease